MARTFGSTSGNGLLLLLVYDERQGLSVVRMKISDPLWRHRIEYKTRGKRTTAYLIDRAEKKKKETIKK